jgi:hypothetical protein
MQRILATWIAKTVMVADRLDRDASCILQPERTWLKEKLCPPPRGWYIWLGSYSGADLRDLGIYQHQTKLDIPSVDNDTVTRHNLELTMIGMRELIFLIISSSWSRLWDILEGMTTPETPGLIQIWPVGSRRSLGLDGPS